MRQIFLYTFSGALEINDSKHLFSV